MKLTAAKSGLWGVASEEEVVGLMTAAKRAHGCGQ